MLLLKTISVEEFEIQQQEIADLLGLDCRYAGTFEKPDIRLVDGTFGIPYPTKKKNQDKVSKFLWEEIDENLIKKEDAEFN